MKRIDIKIWSREEIEQRLSDAAKIINELDQVIANGHQLSDFGRFRYAGAMKRASECRVWLSLNLDEYYECNGELVQAISPTPIQINHSLLP